MADDAPYGASSGFSMTQASGMGGGTAPPSPEQNAGWALQNSAAWLKETKDRDAGAQKAALTTTSIDEDGKVHVTIPDVETANIFHQKMKMADHISQLYQQKIDENEKRQQALKAHPFANALAQIAANVGATSKNATVRGLGGAAQALNPTMGQLQGQQMELMKGGEQAAEHQIKILDSLEQHKNMQAYRQQQLDQKADAPAKTFHELGAAAQKGELTDPKITSKVLENAGHPKEKADALATLLVGASKEKQKLVAEAQAATDKKAQDALKERMRESDQRTALLLKAVTLKASDKENSDKAIEETAKSIAAGDLSSIKDISSFRGSERTRIYARAKEINPNFSVAETKRKIDMEQSFTVGKDGQAIQSFGTFLEHAGEVTETLKGMYQSGSPLFNKPMNWIRKNAEGSPEYQRLLTSIEPVGKEFESFLLSNRALYADDRKRIETLLSGDSSPAQIMSALGQMGKTAKDRYTEMNQRYKRVMKQDIENPFGPEAISGAAKIGIDIGSPGGKTEKYPWEK